MTLKIEEQFIAKDILLAETLIQRRVGLLNTSILNPGQGLAFKGGPRLHTKGMHTSIDILYLDETFRTLKVLENVAPESSSIKAPPSTAWVFELASGTLAPFSDKLTLMQPLKVLIS